MKSFFCIIFLFLLSITTLAKSREHTVVFIGDSLSAGFGVSKEDGYVHLSQKIIQTKYHHNPKFMNGSISGSTTSSLLSRLRFFKQYKPSLIVIALGANDGLRGAKIESIRKNLEEGILYARELSIPVLLVGMYMPPNYGVEYTLKFRQMFSELSNTYQLPFVPFLLRGVAGIKKFNQPDGIHPNELGHKKIAQFMSKKLVEILYAKLN